MSLHIMVRYQVQEEKLDAALAAIKIFVTAVHKSESGRTLRYDAYQLPDKISFVHFMTFADESARDTHSAAVHTKKFVDALYPLCTQEPVFTDLKLV